MARLARYLTSADTISIGRALRNFFFYRSTVIVGPGLLLVEASQLHSDTPFTLYNSSGPMFGPSQRPVYLTTYSNHKTMPLAGFEPAIPTSERPQTHSLDRVAYAIGTGMSDPV